MKQNTDIMQELNLGFESNFRFYACPIFGIRDICEGTDHPTFITEVPLQLGFKK